MKALFNLMLLLLAGLGAFAQPDTATTAEFEKLKGKLLLPVDHFTKLINTEMRRKIARNRVYYTGAADLTIQSDTIMHVRTPASGKVHSIFDVDGRMVIVICHGNYYLGYGNLDAVLLVKGDLVEVGQELGMVINRSFNDIFELDVLMVDEKNNKLDPFPWFYSSTQK